MSISTTPAPPDSLRVRSRQLIGLLSDNSGQIAEISRAVVVLQTSNAHIEAKIFDVNVLGPVYSGSFADDLVRKAILCELVDTHHLLIIKRVKLQDELKAINAQLSALGLNETKGE
jgi:hypothetical protein